MCWAFVKCICSYASFRVNTPLKKPSLQRSLFHFSLFIFINFFSGVLHIYDHGAGSWIRFLVTSLDKALLHQLLSLAEWPALGRVLVVPSFFHLRIMEATVLLGTFSAAEIFCSLSQICASIQSCIWALQAVPLTSWLGFRSDMHCQLWGLL